jgi:hypothetical protein
MATKAELEAEISRLQALLGGEEPRFLKVENLSINYVTLLHPSGENRLHKTLAPKEVTLVSTDFQNCQDNVFLVGKGIIQWEPADDVQDDGRNLALGPQFRLNNPALEGAVRQFLLFPGEDLDKRRSGAIRIEGNQPDVDAMAHILWELINATPEGEGTGVNVDYLKGIHLSFLENVLMRERLWRNRPGLTVPIAKRIEEIRRMDISGRVSPVVL